MGTKLLRRMSCSEVSARAALQAMLHKAKLHKPAHLDGHLKEDAGRAVNDVVHLTAHQPAVSPLCWHIHSV